MNIDNKPLKPIFRWAGGKSWLIKHLKKFEIPNFNSYHEPFFGGGSVFFSLKPKNDIYLSDLNNELINSYKVIRDYYDDLIYCLSSFKNTKDHYYSVRSSNPKCPIERAARFVYLNRTGFNGIYRVNLKGEYNVPFGFKTYKTLFEYDHIKSVSNALKNVNFTCRDFDDSIHDIKPRDLVFIDPPYTVTHVQNGFVKYNEKIFSWSDQERLAQYIKKVKERGAFYMLTNAKHKTVSELFGEIDEPIEIDRASTIGGLNAKRGRYPEYIFSNLRLEGKHGI